MMNKAIRHCQGALAEARRQQVEAQFVECLFNLSVLRGDHGSAIVYAEYLDRVQRWRVFRYLLAGSGLVLLHCTVIAAIAGLWAWVCGALFLLLANAVALVWVSVRPPGAPRVIGRRQGHGARNRAPVSD